MTDRQKMIEEEARRYASNMNLRLIGECDTDHNIRKYTSKRDFEAGANFALSQQPEILFDFFIWFRENGEKYIDMSVEKMIEIYLKDKNDGK